MSESDSGPERPPVLRIVHGGDPGPEAIAALVVALSATAPAPGKPKQASGWADRRAMLRRPLDHGPGRWVASARPAR